MCNNSVNTFLRKCMELNERAWSSTQKRVCSKVFPEAKSKGFPDNLELGAK